MLTSLSTKKESVKDVRTYIQKHYSGSDLALASELLARRAREPVPKRDKTSKTFKQRLSVLYVIDNCIGKAAKQAVHFERVVLDVVRLCAESRPEGELSLSLKLQKVIGEAFGQRQQTPPCPSCPSCF